MPTDLKRWQYIQRLKERYPNFWASLTAAQREKYVNMAINYAQADRPISEFMDRVRETNIYTNFRLEQQRTPPGPPEMGVTDPEPDPGVPVEEPPPVHYAEPTGPGAGTQPTPGPEPGPPGGIPEPDPNAPPEEPPPPPGTGEHNPVPPDPEPTPEPDPDPTPTPTPTPDIDEDARHLLQQFLTDNELPLSLMTFIEGALIEGWSFDRIVSELRNTPEYKAAYPENASRMENGFEWWNEAQIREYRSEARRLALEYLGVGNLSNAEIASMIENNRSLVEWERRLVTYQQFERWGPAVKEILSAELGFQIDDERVFALMSPDISTPELERTFEMALLRGQPASLGLGIRPEEEADLLRQFGISPEQAFRGYQDIVGELPRQERLAAIEREISRTPANFPAPSDIFSDAEFGEVFMAIQLNDPAQLQKLRDRVAREVARHQSRGGPVMSEGGALVGLLSRGDRT